MADSGLGAINAIGVEGPVASAFASITAPSLVSEVPAVISSLIADSVSLPSDFPTAPADVSSLQDALSVYLGQFQDSPTGSGSDDATPTPDDVAILSDFISQLATPGAKVSDYPALVSANPDVLSSAFANGGFAESDIPYHVSAAIQFAGAQISELGIPGSIDLTALPAAVSSAENASETGGSGDDNGEDGDDEDGDDEDGDDESGSPATTDAGETTAAASADQSEETASQSEDAQAAESTSADSGAPTLSLVGWTGALAGIAAGAVAFL